MDPASSSPLGKAVAYRDDYDASLLFPIARQTKRDELGIGAPLPFHGVDVWNAYELSWLDPGGKPHVALVEFRVPAQSPNIVESKSFKLYLNSYAQSHFADVGVVRDTLHDDLTHATGADVAVEVVEAGRFARESLVELDGECIDVLDIAIDDYGPPKPAHLVVDATQVVDEVLVSHLLKSNCPVTGQPDWASVQIRYRGPRIDRAGLLRYVVSFRRHSDFHEQCVERIWCDVQRRCAPQRLSVYARYTRRGGLDINPYRSSDPDVPSNPRGARQ